MAKHITYPKTIAEKKAVKKQADKHLEGLMICMLKLNIADVYVAGLRTSLESVLARHWQTACVQEEKAKQKRTKARTR